ncbi:MAG: hypothetical protein RIQ70_1281, partial [Bacteroidota bacterium]
KKRDPKTAFFDTFIAKQLKIT